MKVDVVVLTRNSVKPCLKECLESLRNNVPVNRLIVVDGNSTDGTIELAKEYNKYFPVETTFDRSGRAKAREIGIKLAKTDWFLFLDSDVILCDNWFEKASKHMKEGVGGIWGAVLPRAKTDSDIYRAMSKVYGKNELWIAMKAGQKRGLTHDTLIRTEAAKDIQIPIWLHVLEDHYIRQYVESKGYKWLSIPEAYCTHFPQGQERPRDYYLTGWCGKKIGFLKTKDIIKYFTTGLAKAAWIYLNSRNFHALKTQLYVYVYTIKGWMNG
ncbi:MAG: hypothetical protein QG670_1102 [Thermoproteota archaeon]|nr:hypothetical protein [Thermoproteota archaeon]